MDSVRASIGPALADRYSIERELGSGAMALVFLANDLKHDRWVAIKVLKPDVASAIGSERFHREIEVVAGLTHPHILPLHDSGEAAGLLYFVMPYVEGESLRARLSREGPVPTAEATQIARDMADALASAHSHGVIHRDVKPGNIMLSAGHAQLADFGIAHLVEGAEATLTGTGITVGTPAYMSPEQASGDEELDGRSDLYSLGCVLYEMLCGHPPFEDASRRAVLVHQMVDAPSDIRGECPDVPLELVGVIKKSLEKEPGKRFASANGMSTALASVRSSINVTAGARIRRALKEKGRRLKSWQRAAIIGLIVLAALGAPTILSEVFRPASQAIGAVDDARGSYVVIPFARRGQTGEDEEITAELAALLAYRLDGWDHVDATLEHELSGSMLELGIDGPTFPTLDDGLRVARAAGSGTMIGITTFVVGDTMFLVSRTYNVNSGEPLGGSTQTQAPTGDLQTLVTPVANLILDFRGEDSRKMLRESRSQEAWQEIRAARKALYDWRLREAEDGFRRTIALDPDFARAHHYLAVTLFWKTTRDIELRRDLIPTIQRITTEADRLAAEADLNPTLEAHIAALDDFAKGHYESARTGYNELIASDSTDLDAWLFLGVVESTDPWLEEGSDPPSPRGNINLAREAFRFTSRRWPESQISRGLEFEIVGKLGDDLVRAQCPIFWYQTADLVLPPYTNPDEAEGFPLFPLIEADTVRWTPCIPLFEEIPRSEARVRFGPAARRLHDESIAEIERWVRFAPEQPRPREEWADMVLWWRSRLACDADTAVTSSLTREALGHLETALALSTDTTAQQQITHAVLRMAAGLANAAETARVVDGAIEGLSGPRHEQYVSPSWTVTNAYLAAGQPAKAIERMRGIWIDEARSVPDPTDEAKTRYEYGDVFQPMGEIRVLGAAGATGAKLNAAVEAVSSVWAEPIARRGVVLRWSTSRERARSADIRPALALDSGMRDLWFSAWGDLEQGIPPLWKGLLATEQQSDSTAAWLEQETGRLETMWRPFATEYFLTGLLAQRAGDDEVAADLFGKIQQCPLNVKSLDVGWGLSRLSRLYRARSLERLGRYDEAAAEYAVVAAEWADGGPAITDQVEAAVRGVDRLAGGL